MVTMEFYGNFDQGPSSKERGVTRVSKSHKSEADLTAGQMQNSHWEGQRQWVEIQDGWRRRKQPDRIRKHKTMTLFQFRPGMSKQVRNWVPFRIRNMGDSQVRTHRLWWSLQGWQLRVICQNNRIWLLVVFAADRSSEESSVVACDLIFCVWMAFEFVKAIHIVL